MFHKRRIVKCKQPGCENMIRYDPRRSGFCQSHYDCTDRAEHLARYNREVKAKPEEQHYRTQDDYTVDCVCKVCGKPFKARVGTVKYDSSQGGHCCSFKCVGIVAAKKTPKKATAIERAIELALIRRHLPYQSQVPLCGVTLADFFLPTLNVVIFCDGEFWHRLAERQAHDRLQDETLRSAEYIVFRFSEADIKRSPDACLDQINLCPASEFCQLSLPNAG